MNKLKSRLLELLFVESENLDEDIHLYYSTSDTDPIVYATINNNNLLSLSIDNINIDNPCDLKTIVPVFKGFIYDENLNLTLNIILETTGILSIIMGEENDNSAL